MLKLNCIPNDVFEASNTSDTKIKVCGAEINRRDLVATGRLVVCEFIGKSINNDKTNLEKYNSRLAAQNIDYASFAKAFRDKKLLFCAAQAYKASGQEMPENIGAVKNDLSLMSDPVFLRTLSALDRDILTPLLFRVFDDVSMGGLMQWESAPAFGHKEIEIRSNDIVVFEDTSLGSFNNTTISRLYNKTLTLTPKATAAITQIKWTHMFEGDAGDYYNAMIRGLWNKVYAKFAAALKAAKDNQKYMPAKLTYASYTSDNWNNLIDDLSAANGVDANDLMAFGARTALSKVVPTDSTGGAILGMQYGLGERWTAQGYLGNVGGVDLCPIRPVLVPGTQNTKLTKIFPTDEIYMVAKGGEGNKPMYGVYAEGQPITLTAEPSKTEDFTLNINMEAMFDIAPMFASKVGLIKNVA